MNDLAGAGTETKRSRFTGASSSADVDFAALLAHLLLTARREARRFMRLARLISHLLVGAALAHSALLLLRTRRDPRAADALVRWWNRRLVAALGLRLTVHGQPARGAVLYVSNHISWLDIALLRSIVDASFVAKDEVHQWPVVGAMAACAGTIFLARGASEANGGVADRMTWSFTQGSALILFPEGTTTDGTEVRHFHPRLYQAAIRTRAYVQAVAVSYPDAQIPGGTHPAAPFIGEQSLVGHLWRLLAEPGLEARVSFCEPLNPAGHARRALADVTRAQIQRALGVGIELASTGARRA